MPVLRIKVKVSSTAKLDRLARRLNAEADGGMQAELTKALNAEGPKARKQVAAAFQGVQVTAIPSRGGGKSSGLRARVGAATTTNPVHRGVRVEVESNLVDPKYGNTLSWGLNGLGRWRHPTFGRRGAGQWVSQRGEEVFFKTMRGHTGWAPRLERALEKVARRIEG